MIRSLRLNQLFLMLVIFTVVAASCSSPKYYVYKTVTNKPYTADASQEVTSPKDETNTQASSEGAENEAAPIEEQAFASASPSTPAEAVSVEKARQAIAEKSVPVAVEKSSKLQEVKTALKVKKEVKEIKKALKDNQGIKSENKITASKSQLIALLLAIFLGGLGIHRFYLGYTWQGIVQIALLLTSFLIIPGIALLIWVLVDIIRIATGNLGPKDGSGYDETL